jgi:serine/threonine-protein kinase HipA
MADTVVDVVVQIAGEDVPAGRLWSHRARRGESATFAYSPEYLKRDDSYELDPLLPKNTGQQQTPEGRALFGALSDAAPDGWGRRLIRRREIHHAEEHKTAERDITEIEYLLGVRDGLRQGALRLRDPDTGGYLAEEVADIPQLLDLSRLLDAAEQLERHEDTAEDLRLLLDGGSSLGGARPKAHVIDPGGHIGIAKFPAPETDRCDVIRWEAVALTLAREAGVSVPEFQLHEIAKRPVLIVRRFDRDTGGRIGYLGSDARDERTGVDDELRGSPKCRACRQRRHKASPGERGRPRLRAQHVHSARGRASRARRKRNPPEGNL